MKNLYKNDNVSVMFYEKTEYSKPYIIVRDLTDRYNEPTAYTRKIRGIDKCWKYIVEMFESDELGSNLKFREIMRVMEDQFKLDVHSYCAID